MTSPCLETQILKQNLLKINYTIQTILLPNFMILTLPYIENSILLHNVYSKRKILLNHYIFVFLKGDKQTKYSCVKC